MTSGVAKMNLLKYSARIDKDELGLSTTRHRGKTYQISNKIIGSVSFILWLNAKENLGGS